MVDSPQISLKVIFGVHLVLTTWASMVGTPFLGHDYVYFNGFILAFGFWAIVAPDSTEAVLMFLVLTGSSMVQDIIFISVHAPKSKEDFNENQKSLYHFCLGMSIINLLLKPFTSFVLYRVYQSRGGRYGDFGIGGGPQFTGPSSGAGYENLEPDAPPHGSNVETAAPHNTYKPPQ